MSWLSRVRKGIHSLTKRQSADNLWHKCGKCGSMVFTKEWEDNLSSARAATIMTGSAPARFEHCSIERNMKSWPAPRSARTR